MNPRSGPSNSQHQQQHPRSAAMNPSSSYPNPQSSNPASSAARPGPRLQNTQKSAVGNGTGGWGSFGMPASSGGGAFGALGAGVGGAPGFGAQARPGQLSGFAQVMGGGGAGQGPIDMSDFPSLSGGPRAAQAQQGNANAASWNSTAIRQPSNQQQQPQPQQTQQRAPSAAPSQQSIEQYDGQRSQQAPTDRRAGSGDDFPPLGGQLNGEGVGGSNGFSSGYGSPDQQQQPRSSSQQNQLPIRDASSTYQQAPIGQQSTLQAPSQQQQSQPQTNQQQQSQSTPGVKKYADLTESEKWGLPGLMTAFESRKQAESGSGAIDDTLPPSLRSAIIMGHDLNSLGMDLDAPDPLYPTFTPFQAVGSTKGSFDFHDRSMIPDFTLPSAYTVTNVPPLSSRMSAFSDETLFSIFYQHPRDILQDLAAHELITRDWRWHKVLRQWLQKDSREATSASASSLQLIDLTNGAPLGGPAVRKSERMEHGVFVCFDAMNWRRERRWMDLDYSELDPPRVVGPGMNGVGGAAGLQPPLLQPPLQPPLGLGAQGPGRLVTGGEGMNVGGGLGSSQIPSG